jgi:hypothetical protein
LVRGDLTVKKTVILGTVFATVLVLALPFVGGGGPSFLTPARAAEASFVGLPVAATSPVASGAVTHVDTAAAIAAVSKPTATIITVAPASSVATAALTTDSEHLAQKPVPIPVVVPHSRPQARAAPPRAAAEEARPASRTTRARA